MKRIMSIGLKFTWNQNHESFKINLPVNIEILSVIKDNEDYLWVIYMFSSTKEYREYNFSIINIKSNNEVDDNYHYIDTIYTGNDLYSIFYK